jgi:L-cystine uptake protein TcyP (sodium:dicarboxylate symporter family)
MPMYSLSRKVECVTDITLGRIVRLKNYRVQRKKLAKRFVIAGASTAFLFIVFLHVFVALCIYKCFSTMYFIHSILLIIVRICDFLFLKRFLRLLVF